MIRVAVLSLFAFAGGAACGDNLAVAPDSNLGDNAPPDSDQGEPLAMSEPGAVPLGIGFAVVNSDYHTTSISLLDLVTGQVANGDCINSGTRPPGNTLALSGDVALPSQPQPGNLLVTIDHGNSVLTWIDPATCVPLRQLDVGTGFYSNPHDVIGISPTKAYVTRYERNAAATPDPADHDDGDDLLIIDPSIPSITGRIDLASYAVAVAGAAIQARPDRALVADGKLFVALSNLAGDFRAAGTGRLVVIDPATDAVTGVVDLPGLKNCSGLSYVETAHVLVVACGGAFSDADQAAGSGIAYIDAAASPPVELRRQPVTPFGGRALASLSAIARDGALGFAVTSGEFTGGPTDQLWALDVAAASATLLVDSSESFTFGSVVVDRSHQRAYLPDANADHPRVQIYSYAGAAPALAASINANPTIGLPPREIAWY